LVPLLAWLLPDTSYIDQHEGWTRRDYRPRHGKPPTAVRGWRAAMAAARAAEERYLGGWEEGGVPSQPRL